MSEVKLGIFAPFSLAGYNCCRIRQKGKTLFSEPAPPPDYQKVIDTLEEDTRKVGLYLNGWTVPSEGLLIMTFNVGDIAFSERVLDPESDKVHDEVRGMESDLEQEENREMKNELKADLEDFDED